MRENTVNFILVLITVIVTVHLSLWLVRVHNENQNDKMLLPNGKLIPLSEVK